MTRTVILILLAIGAGVLFGLIGLVGGIGAFRAKERGAGWAGMAGCFLGLLNGAAALFILVATALGQGH